MLKFIMYISLLFGFAVGQKNVEIDNPNSSNIGIEKQVNQFPQPNPGEGEESDDGEKIGKIATGMYIGYVAASILGIVLGLFLINQLAG